MSGESVPGSTRARAAVLAELLLILLVFFRNGAWPVPDGNETYYLAKAKHFWDPQWGQGVLFLESRNAHTIFYVLFGWLGRFVSLTALAWSIRACTWSLLAVAWQRLSYTVVPRRGWAVISAALLVAVNEHANMAGEWIVGGAEAKGLAYVLVFLALERMVRNDWKWVWPLMGLATSMHPLVGGWALAATVVVSLSLPRDPARRTGPWLLGFLAALPGLWWALRLNAGTDPATVHEAARIIVFERAPHHLLPESFPRQQVLRHLGLWVLGAVLLMGRPFPGGVVRLQRFTTVAMGIALAGVLLALATRGRPILEATLLQYYWFRLSDAIVPLGIVLTGLFLIERLWPRRRPLGLGILAALTLLGTMHLAERTRRIQSATAPRSDWALAHPAAWRDVCAWTAAHTDPAARFLTPPGGATFLWYSGRRDVVNWKDVPQDAAGIVAWAERMREIHGPDSPAGVARARASLGDLGAERLRELGRKHDAGYAVVALRPGLVPLDLAPVYRNEGYVVVRLGEE